MANTTKMTKAQALSQIKELVADYPELVAYADNELALLAKKAQRSAEKNAEKDAAYTELRTQIAGVLAGGRMTATEIAKAIDPETLTNQKVTYALRTMQGVTVVKEKGKSYYSIAE